MSTKERMQEENVMVVDRRIVREMENRWWQMELEHSRVRANSRVLLHDCSSGLINL